MSKFSLIYKMFFVFCASLPYALFRISYFAVNFPRRIRKHRDAPKRIAFECLSEKHLSVLEMVEHVHELEFQQGRKRFAQTPSMMTLFEALWDEEMSPHWKIPTVLEIRQIRDSVLAGLQTVQPDINSFHVWAISERPSMFVAFDLSSGEYQHALPKDIFAILQGNAPDSQNKCFAVVVSVTAIFDEKHQ